MNKPKDSRTVMRGVLNHQTLCRKGAERIRKMKCDLCKNDFPDEELAEVEATPQDEEGKPTGASKKFHVCEMCCMVKLLGVDEESAREMMQEGTGE